MARIPDAELERLKQDIALQRLAEARGIKLKRHGTDLIGLCPFHDDHEPSLVITPDKNLWHCLGACQTGGTVIDWVMKAEGVSFRHAVELLRNDLPLAASTAPVKRSTVTKLPAPLDHSVEDQALLMQVVDYYHEALKESPEALAHLKTRGLDHPDMIDHFKLGYANRTIPLLLFFYNYMNTTTILTQGGYKATLIDAESYLLTCYRYIELNPVRAGMVKHPAEYPWSSHGFNALGKADALVAPHALYLRLGSDEESRRNSYRALFKHSLEEGAADAIREATNKAWVLGNDRFKARIKDLLDRQVAPRTRGGDRKSQSYRERRKINRV